MGCDHAAGAVTVSWIVENSDTPTEDVHNNYADGKDIHIYIHPCTAIGLQAAMNDAERGCVA